MNEITAAAIIENNIIANIDANRSYASLKFADALAHLNEVVMGEFERFESDTGARVASVKIKRDKDTDVLKSVQCHVRS